MKIYSPYTIRLAFAKGVFWLVLALLVNGWVDFANHSLRGSSWLKANDAIVADDYDTLYEWIAEEWFDVEQAIPEQEQDADDNAKSPTVKLTLACHHVSIEIPGIGNLIFHHTFSRLERYNPPHLGLWAPPPNATCLA